MAGSEERNRGGVVPLTLDQVFRLLEATPISSPAALLCRVEDLLLRGTGATSVDAFLVDYWFNKLLHSVDVTEGADDRGKAGVAARVIDGRDSGRNQGQRQRQEAVFRTRAECDIGDGIAGMAAMTGRKLRVRDCSKTRGRRPENPLYYTHHTSGSLICWPVRKKIGHTAAADRDATVAAATEKAPFIGRLEDVEVDADTADEPPGATEVSSGVLAVLQLHCAEGELSAEALEVVRGAEFLLVPLLTEAIARVEDTVQRRSAEAMLALSAVVPRQMGLIAMIDEIIRVAHMMMDAESVSFFFVDHEAHELLVAESASLGEQRFKIGEGLCGHAAETGATVNVIDSYRDSRFDRRWDQRTGSITKSALCVPIPPPQHTDINTLRKAGYGFQSRVPLATDGSHSQQGVSSPSSSSPSREHGGPESADRAERQVRRDSLRQLSKTSARPLAVLKAINNRGSGIFNEHEERALVRLCAGVETLLRRKAAEVSLLWSGMTERTLVRKSNIRGGPGGAWSNYARVESTIMRLYSEASFPADAVRRLRLHTRKRGAAKHHQRSLSDSTNNVSVDFAQESGSSTEVNPQGDGVGRQAVDDNKANRVHRMLTAEVELVDLSMSLFELGSDRLLSLVARFFRSMELTNTFKIPEQKMWSFLRAVDHRYPPNAFHNLIHAVSVTHVSFVMVKTTEISSLLRPLDKLALLFAAFCHDIDHPGNNNAFEVNSISSLALRYGDSSVLERHHVFVAYQVLLQEGGANNIFSGLTRAQFRDARQTIIEAILGTDMSGHMEHCADVFQLAQRAERRGVDEDRGGGGGGLERATSNLTRSAGGTFDRAAVPPPPPSRPFFCGDTPKDRAFLTKAIIHCADLSGQALDNPLALEWGRRILEEFRLQARQEANSGLPRTTVASGDMETTIKGQHFFALKIVKPLWEPFVALFPKLKPFLERLNMNCEYYRQEGLRLERIRLSETSNALSPQQERREGDENDGDDESDNSVNNSDGRGRGCDSDHASPPAEEERARAGKMAVGDGERDRSASPNNCGGG